MAKIQTETIIITLSKLIKNNTEEVTSITNDDFTSNLETIVQELVGENVIVEVNTENL